MLLIIVAATAGMSGLLVGLLIKSAHRSARHRAEVEAADWCRRPPEEPTSPAPVIGDCDLLVPSPPAVGRARVYHIEHPSIDVLQAVLAGLRRL